jgi:hypothetical protein
MILAAGKGFAGDNLNALERENYSRGADKIYLGDRISLCEKTAGAHSKQRN